jgi:surface antigen
MHFLQPRTPRRLALKAALATLWVFAFNAGASATELGFLVNTVAAKLNEQDMKLMREAALGLLKEGDVGASRDWANPNSTATGKITVVKIFKSTEGFACKSVRSEASAGGLQGRDVYRVCEVHPGKWRIYAGARPAAS